ncbi:unnamed protein product [Sphagnum jensenii]|uniref:Uncharacterized protein n=1 Tax=Sphagnum jensenii TaxID=128206 RepID=A0ABP0VAD2_9BRYO
MTGAATLPTLATTPTKSSNNSGATGVTLTKGSNTTPKNADTISASTVNAYRVTSSPTAATPQGIFKSTHMSASAVQTDEPPKKLRKILPANNSSATTPKALPITINCSTSTTLSSTTTSSSTVNSLRQCRINTDKNKSLCSTVNTNSNVGLSVCKPSVKEETKCVNSAITTTSLGSVKKSSSRKSSAFDVRTLIGTKSPTLPSQRQCVESAISGNECKDEIGINDKNSTNTTSIGNNGIGVKPAKGNSNVSLSSSVRELNRNTVTSSMCSMPSTLSSITTAKSTSVNVTSTTPTLELSKTKTASGLNTNIASGFKSNISGAQTLGLSSTKVSANEVNDDKVSTTTNESGVSSSIHKDESAIKALTSATTNTGNLVIRISTKSHSVESFTQLKDKDKNSTQRTNKFEIKRDQNLSKLNPQTDGNNTQCLNGKNDNNHKSETELKSVNNLNDDEDDDDDDNSIDGRKLVVDVPNEDSCENEVGTSKVTLEMDDIDSGRGSDIIRLSCDDIEMGSPQSTTLSIKTPESLSASSDISTKLAINITSTTTLSANSAVLASPPPTPSPKSESDPCITVVTKSNKSSSSPPNGPLDLSMSSTNKKDSYQKIVTPPAIYDIPAPKPKHCVNPAVLDKHRGLFPPGLSAPNKQHPSFKIITTPSHSSRQQPQQSSSFLPSTNFNSSKKDRSINPNPSITTTGSSSSNQSRNRSQVSHHHQHHHHHKNYSVITPDPHRYTPKLVIKNISSPPSITSHFNYPTHH